MALKIEPKALRLMSVLLGYPKDDWLKALPEFERAVTHLSDDAFRQAIGQFLYHLTLQSLSDLQTAYTASFDLNPSTTLNLSWHRYGDSEERAAMLSRLQQLYHQAGWDRVTSDLPDYLPLLLEFLSVCPDPDKAVTVWECLQSIEVLAQNLATTAPVYTDLMRPLIRIAADHRQNPAADKTAGLTGQSLADNTQLLGA